MYNLPLIIHDCIHTIHKEFTQFFRLKICKNIFKIQMKMKSQSPIAVWIVVRFSEEQRMQHFYKPDNACRSWQTWLSWRKQPCSLRWVNDRSYLISVVRASSPEAWNVFMLRFSFFTPYWVSVCKNKSNNLRLYFYIIDLIFLWNKNNILSTSHFKFICTLNV